MKGAPMCVVVQKGTKLIYVLDDASHLVLSNAKLILNKDQARSLVADLTRIIKEIP
jgi:hypothetical protein